MPGGGCTINCSTIHGSPPYFEEKLKNNELEKVQNITEQTKESQKPFYQELYPQN
jgi:hypothetical protein